MSADEHVSSGDLAAYLDGQLDADGKANLQAHLADCDECRGEVTEIASVLRTRARRRSWAVAIPVLAAAGVGAVLLAGPMDFGQGMGANDRLRPGSAVDLEAVPEILVRTPVRGSTVGPGLIEFDWEGVEPAASYRFTLTDEGGDPLWTAETTETELTLPMEVSLEPGGRFFWFVDALLADGGSATTGIHSFTVRP